MARYQITGAAGVLEVEVHGRLEWALLQLAEAGARGCTPIDNPAPRWSGYVHALRELGVDIETVTERHSGPFPGNHARYVLHGLLTRPEDSNAA